MYLISHPVPATKMGQSPSKQSRAPGEGGGGGGVGGYTSLVDNTIGNTHTAIEWEARLVTAVWARI